VQRCLGAVSILCTTCAPMPAAIQSAAPAQTVDCTTSGTATSSEDNDAATKLRDAVERSPFYAVSAARIGVKTCHATQSSDEQKLEYTFRDGGWLHVTRQRRIEYSDQEVRFATPLADDPMTVLADAERAAFGNEGCGMTWRDARTRPAEDDANAKETIYFGDVCNCQARVRTNAAGRVTGLLLRSAC
jgi:hypothetical protein